MVKVPEDSVYELSRAGDGAEVREACKAAAKLVEEDDSIDECYKAVLLSLLNGSHDKRKEKAKTCDVVGEKRKPEALEKSRKNTVVKKERLVSEAKNARSSSPLNKSAGKIFEVGSSSKTISTEVEILNSDVISRKGISSPFISSIKHCTLNEDPSATRFRKEVLEVLRRPFDKEEYKKCRGEVRDKSYTKYYPCLQKKLTEFRYRKDKCLIILRGFFFWLQNLTREGSFQPWLDETCLRMELPSS